MVCDCTEGAESAIAKAELPHVLEAHLHTRDGAKDKHRTIQHTQRTFHLNREINVTCTSRAPRVSFLLPALFPLSLRAPTHQGYQ